MKTRIPHWVLLWVIALGLGLIFAMGCERDDNDNNFIWPQPIKVPAVSTMAVGNITETTATIRGNIYSDSGSSVFERGVRWSTDKFYEQANRKIDDSTGIGRFTISITGLTPNTTYYVWAYATNDNGSGYGNAVSFSTAGTTITDIDGNVYKTVVIGTQVWMAENLRTTRLNDGDYIPLVTNNVDWYYLSTPGFCWYNNNESSYKSTYGALYKGYTESLCPPGWHQSNSSDWEILCDYLGGDSIAGGKIKAAGTMFWNAPNTGATNETGFTALPGGYRSDSGVFYYIEDGGIWYPGYSMTNNDAKIRSFDYGYNNGLSVRCVRN